MKAFEVNFDGLIGPTHNYAGLAVGNLASTQNAQLQSNPRLAALQGLSKMRRLLNKGYLQGIFPPQHRPDLNVLRRLGFSGNDREVIRNAARSNPNLLSLVYSSSAMWAANAATVTPGTDSGDGRVHFTPANLLTTAHRSIEAKATEKSLREIFADPRHFKVHAPLPTHSKFADEGAANHSRLCPQYHEPGIGMYVYGRTDESDWTEGQKFPARQTLAASQSVARLHDEQGTIFIRQATPAIDAGAFHNDVVAVANGPVLFYHAQAFAEGEIERLQLQTRSRFCLQRIEVPTDRVTLTDAIESYLFNSQLLASPEGNMNQMLLLAPKECQTNKAVSDYLDDLIQDPSQPIRSKEFVDLRESMCNGGGPACLRLRVVMNAEQLAAVNPRFLLDDQKIDQLENWVTRYYRDRLIAEDLADIDLMHEVTATLEALTKILGLGNYYSFQR